MHLLILIREQSLPSTREGTLVQIVWSRCSSYISCNFCGPIWAFAQHLHPEFVPTKCPLMLSMCCGRRTRRMHRHASSGRTRWRGLGSSQSLQAHREWPSPRRPTGLSRGAWVAISGMVHLWMIQCFGILWWGFHPHRSCISVLASISDTHNCISDTNFRKKFLLGVLHIDFQNLSYFILTP